MYGMISKTYLAHVGVSKLNGAKVGSGRYPLGSGKRPNQHLDGSTKGLVKTDTKNYSRNDDIVLKKGTKAYRVSEHKDLSSGQIYTSFRKLDHVKYISASSVKAGVAMHCEGNGNDGRAYSLNLVLNKDIVAPSYAKTMDTFIKTVEDSGGAKKFTKSLGGTSFDQKNKAKEFVKLYRRKNKQECLDQAYVQFSGTLFKDTKARNIFINNLQRQGYNAILDDFDFRMGGSKNYTKSPFIIFDSSNVTKTKTTPLTEKDYEYFRDIYYSGSSSDLNTAKKWKKKAGINSSDNIKTYGSYKEDSTEWESLD